MNPGAVLQVELNGPIAGSSYDQLQVIGGVNITGATLNIDGIGPMPLQKIIGGALVGIESGDCIQNVPILLRAYGSPVTAFLLSPDGAPAIGWVSNVIAQSTSQAAVTLASAPTAGSYRITYYMDQDGTCTTGSCAPIRRWPRRGQVRRPTGRSAWSRGRPAP